MKLLLTSGGITNKSIAKALKKMVKGRIRFAFIPTAANVEDSDKKWLINDLNNCQKLGTVDVVDISAIPKKLWLPRLKKANVIFFGGGNTTYLMKQVAKSGLKKELPLLLKQRVYVGLSAGSIIASRTLFASSDYLFYGAETVGAPKGLGFVDFNVRPHLNSKHFPNVRDSKLKKIKWKFQGKVYALDDDSAILVDGNKIKVISEGVWKVYNETSS
jgi:dipeptidase E